MHNFNKQEKDIHQIRKLRNTSLNYYECLQTNAQNGNLIHKKYEMPYTIPKSIHDMLKRISFVLTIFKDSNGNGSLLYSRHVSHLTNVMFITC